MIRPISKELSLLVYKIIATCGATNLWVRLLGKLWRVGGLSNGAGGKGGEVADIFNETETLKGKVSKGKDPDHPQKKCNLLQIYEAMLSITQGR